MGTYKAGVIVAAGGAGARMGGRAKQFRELNGKPLLRYSLDVFAKMAEVSEIVLVIPPDEITAHQGLTNLYPGIKIVGGGIKRWQSVQKGFEALSGDTQAVVIHDAARPFVGDALTREGLRKAVSGEVVICAIPAADTIKNISGELVLGTLDRRELIQVQTPQFFPRSVLESVYEYIGKGNVPDLFLTDEAGMAEYLKIPVKWIRGSAQLRKVTEPGDFKWAEWMVQNGSGKEND